MSNSLFNLDVYREIMIDAMLEMNDIEYALQGDPYDQMLQEAMFDMDVVVEESFQRYLLQLMEDHNGK